MLYIAHRGASGRHPENTLRAVRAALDLGVDAIEVDVHAVDGELVVIHDQHLDRTTNGRGPLRSRTFEELRQLDAGGGERIPTLHEVAELVSGAVPLIVELKGAETGRAVAQYVAQRVRSGRSRYEDFLVSSFDQYELLAAMETDSRVARAVLFQGVPLGLADFATPLRPHSLHLSHEFIRAAFLADAKQRGHKVYVYTVDDPEEMRMLEQQGVDGVFTNCPSSFRMQSSKQSSPS
jgi:glycerophosphoryl diester phosphodiesterase